MPRPGRLKIHNGAHQYTVQALDAACVCGIYCLPPIKGTTLCLGSGTVATVLRHRLERSAAVYVSDVARMAALADTVCAAAVHPCTFTCWRPPARPPLLQRSQRAPHAAGALAVGPPEERFGLDGPTLRAERAALRRRLAERKGHPRSRCLFLPPPDREPTRREALTYLNWWTSLRNIVSSPYPEVLNRHNTLLWNLGGEGMQPLSNPEIARLLFEGAEGPRPMMGDQVDLEELKLDDKDEGVRGRIDHCAALWNKIREQQYLYESYGRESDVLASIRPILARIIADCSPDGIPHEVARRCGQRLVAPMLPLSPPPAAGRISPPQPPSPPRGGGGDDGAGSCLSVPADLQPAVPASMEEPADGGAAAGASSSRRRGRLPKSHPALPSEAQSEEDTVTHRRRTRNQQNEDDAPPGGRRRRTRSGDGA